MSERPKTAMKSTNQITWAEVILWAVVVLLSPVSGRFILQIVGVVLLVGIAFWWWRRVGRTVLLALSVAWGVLFALPFDIAIRNSTEFSFRVVKVVMASTEDSSGIREIEQRGLKKNVDFVVYRNSGIPIPPYRALLITIPCRYHLSTPLFSDPRNRYGITSIVSCRFQLYVHGVTSCE